jgi:hypothetical protein
MTGCFLLHRPMARRPGLARSAARGISTGVTSRGTPGRAVAGGQPVRVGLGLQTVRLGFRRSRDARRPLPLKQMIAKIATAVSPILPGGFHLGDPRHVSSRSPARFAAMRMAAGRAGGSVRARAAPLRFYPGPAGGINRPAAGNGSSSSMAARRLDSPAPSDAPDPRRRSERGGPSGALGAPCSKRR